MVPQHCQLLGALHRRRQTASRLQSAIARAFGVASPGNLGILSCLQLANSLDALMTGYFVAGALKHDKQPTKLSTSVQGQTKGRGEHHGALPLQSSPEAVPVLAEEQEHQNEQHNAEQALGKVGYSSYQLLPVRSECNESSCWEVMRMHIDTCTCMHV